MATIEAQMQQSLANETAILAALTNIATALGAIATPPAPPPATVDFTAVLAAIAGVAAQVADVQTQIETPPAA